MESEETQQPGQPAQPSQLAEQPPQAGGAIAFLAWVEVNKKRLMVGGAILVVVVLAVSLFVQQQAVRERNASAALSDVKIPWNPAATNPPGSLDALVRVANDYRGTKAGARALLISAGMLFSDRKYTEAEARFAQVTKDYPDSEWTSQAALGIAASLDAQGKTNEAVAKYEEIKRRFDKSAIIEEAKMSLARLYEGTKPEDAFKIYDELTKGLPGTRTAMEASMRQEDLLKARPELAKLKESLNPPPPAPPSLQTPAPQPKILNVTNAAGGTSKPVQIQLNPKPSAAPAPSAGPAAAPAAKPAAAPVAPAK